MGSHISQGWGPAKIPDRGLGSVVGDGERSSRNALVPGRHNVISVGIAHQNREAAGSTHAKIDIKLPGISIYPSGHGRLVGATRYTELHVTDSFSDFHSVPVFFHQHTNHPDLKLVGRKADTACNRVNDHAGGSGKRSGGRESAGISHGDGPILHAGPQLEDKRIAIRVGNPVVVDHRLVDADNRRWDVVKHRRAVTRAQGVIQPGPHIHGLVSRGIEGGNGKIPAAAFPAKDPVCAAIVW